MTEQHIYLVLAFFSLSESHHEELILKHQVSALKSTHCTMSSNLALTTTANCSNVPGNVPCLAPPPPESFLSLLSLRTSLNPIFAIVEFTTLSAAFLGNLLIVLTIMSNKKMLSMAHLFLLNVAVADFLFSALNIAGHATENTLDEVTLKETFCTLYRPLIGVRFAAYAISMFCLAALSVERWYVVCSPISAQFSSAGLLRKLKFSSLALIWIITLAISIPIGFCKVTVTKTFAILLALVLHVIPLTIIITVNTRMVLSLKRNAAFNVSAVNEETREKIRKLLISMILSVIIFWSPYHGFFLYFVFAKPPSSPSAGVKLELAFRAGNIWTYFNPLFNALLYYIFSKEFRSGLASLFLLCSCDRRSEEQNAVNDLARSGQELVRFSTINEAFSNPEVLPARSPAKE